MSTRDAMKITLKLLFEWLPEENGKKYEWTQEGIDNAVELMHDDDTFFRELLDFLADILGSVIGVIVLKILIKFYKFQEQPAS